MKIHACWICFQLKAGFCEKDGGSLDSWPIRSLPFQNTATFSTGYCPNWPTREKVWHWKSWTAQYIQPVACGPISREPLYKGPTMEGFSFCWWDAFPSLTADAGLWLQAFSPRHNRFCFARLCGAILQKRGLCSVGLLSCPSENALVQSRWHEIILYRLLISEGLRRDLNIWRVLDGKQTSITHIISNSKYESFIHQSEQILCVLMNPVIHYRASQAACSLSK